MKNIFYLREKDDRLLPILEFEMSPDFRIKYLHDNYDLTEDDTIHIKYKNEDILRIKEDTIEYISNDYRLIIGFEG